MKTFRIFLASLFLTVVCVLPFVSLHARQTAFEIAAVVNDEVITTHELQNRLNIALHATKLPDSKETRAQLMPQLLQMLIDEALQRQEAKKIGVELSENEIARAQAELEKQNGVAPGKLEEYIRKEGLDKDAVMDQVHTQLLWTKVLYKKVRPLIKLSEQDVAEAMERAKTSVLQGTGEAKLAEIVLAVADQKEEENVKRLASKLYEELNNGADFGAVAKEFSVSSTSDKNGVIGWLPLEDLAPALRQAIDGLEPGGVSLPLRNARGYMILKVLERKQGSTQTAAPDEARVREVLTLRKMELEARRYLSNLRDESFIENRL